ncbi:hypothetical protein AB1Y20_013615 [Prymnesium parvum]|uniref:Uncharacterized protein n=1 Tax=Prymnesium parvum TaxID=97485 RepID=A0AB34IHY5_PRYPA
MTDRRQEPAAEPGPSEGTGEGGLAGGLRPTEAVEGGAASVEPRQDWRYGGVPVSGTGRALGAKGAAWVVDRLGCLGAGGGSEGACVGRARARPARLAVEGPRRQAGAASRLGSGEEPVGESPGRGRWGRARLLEGRRVRLMGAS